MNKLRDWKRRQAHAAAPVFDSVRLGDLEAKADSFWELDFRRELTRRALELMRAHLAPNTWQACWEFIANGKPAAEAARQFGVSENAVHIAKCRVIRHLRRELGGMMD